MARIEQATALQTEISASDVTKRIYTLRGRQVMLDQDLAEIYEVETKVLKQAVKRNVERFPEDFMWRITGDELANFRSQTVTQIVENSSKAVLRPQIRSQFVTEKSESNSVGRRGSRYAPFVFTEHGVAMLSSVLHSERAIQVNIAIIRVFIGLRSKPRDVQVDLMPKLELLETMFKQRFDQLQAHFQTQLPVKQPRAKHYPVNVIQDAVAKHFGLTREDLNSASRTQAISLPRQIAIYLARKTLGMGFTEIGRHFGGRDHSTVLHAYHKIDAVRESNNMIRTAVDSIKEEIRRPLS